MYKSEDFKWVDEDYESLKEYHLTDATMNSIKKFYDYKKRHLLTSSLEDTLFMKQYFQEAHSDLKIECSIGRISPSTLAELTELLKKGV